MVTPTNGALFFRGRSGKNYSVNIYISDVVGAAVTFNTVGAAVAGSQTFWLAPEDVVLVDASIVTGPTVMTNLVPYANDAPVGSTLPIAAFLSTLANRPNPGIGYAAGRKITIIQA